jgi:hypothetical protein
MRIFHKAADYEAFERVLAEGLEHYAVQLLGAIKGTGAYIG